MKMSTSTILSDGKQLTQRTINTLKEVKDKYCPDGETCESILSFVGVFLTFVFMYIAVKPLMIW